MASSAPEFPLLKIMWSLTHKLDFLAAYADRIKAEYFPNPVERLLVRWALDHFLKYGEVITEPAIKSLLIFNEAELDSVDLEDEDFWTLYDELDAVRATEKHYVWNMTERFCEYQAIKIGATTALQLLREGNETGAANAMRRAVTQTAIEETRGLKLMADRSSTMKRIGERESGDDFILSGIPKLDSLMDGGLRPGEVAVFLAPTGRGKTMWLCQTAAMGLLNGSETAYYTLEVDRDEIWLRMMASATNIPINVLRAYSSQSDGDPEYMKMRRARGKSPIEHIEKLQKRLKLTGNGDIDVLIRDIAVRGATLDTIFGDLDTLKRDGHNPKLMILDYADRLQARGHYDRGYEGQEEIYKELQLAAKEFDIAIWTATQSNRSGLDKANLNLTEIQGAFAKAFEATYVLAAGQTKAMQLNNEFKFLMAKARRAGSTNMNFMVKYDHAIARFKGTERPLSKEDAYESNDFAEAMSYQPDEDDEARFERESEEEAARFSKKGKNG